MRAAVLKGLLYRLGHQRGRVFFVQVQNTDKLADALSVVVLCS
jgi:hypothetical protein